MNPKKPISLMRGPLAYLFALVACALGPPPAWGAGFVRRPAVRINRVDTSAPPEVRLYFTETDSAAKVVAARKANAYRLSVDSISQGPADTIQTFAEGKDSMALVLVIQLSPSMQETLTEVINASKRLLRSLGSRVDAGVVAYSNVVHKTLKPTSPDKAMDLLDSLSIDAESLTANLPDAIRDAYELLASDKLPARKVVVVASDGLTEDLRMAVFTDLGRMAAQKGVVVHSLGYAPFEPTRLRTLYELSKSGRGTFRDATDAHGLGQAFADLQEELQGQIMVSKKLPEIFDGDEHDFEIRVAGSSSYDVFTAVTGKLSTAVAKKGVAAPPAKAKSAGGAPLAPADEEELWKSSPGISTGAVVGIVLVCVALVVILVVLFLRLWLRKDPAAAPAVSWDVGKLPPQAAGAAGLAAAEPEETSPAEAAAPPFPARSAPRSLEEEDDLDTADWDAPPPPVAPAPGVLGGPGPAGSPEPSFPVAPGALFPGLPLAGAGGAPAPPGPRAAPLPEPPSPARLPGLMDLPSPEEFLRRHASVLEEPGAGLGAGPPGAGDPGAIPGGGLRPPTPNDFPVFASFDKKSQAAAGAGIPLAPGSNLSIVPSLPLLPPPGGAGEGDAFTYRKTQVLASEELEQDSLVAWIVPLDDPGYPTVRLRNNFVLGSEATCDFIVRGEGVEPRHALINLDGHGYWLRRAATGETSSRQPLQDNDRFRVGDREFLFKLAQPFSDEHKAPVRLEVLNGFDQGRSLPLQVGVPYAIGCHPSCALIVRGEGVGHRHAIALRKRGVCILEDLGTEAGLTYAGQPVGSRALRPGEEIQLGSVRLLFAGEQ